MSGSTGQKAVGQAEVRTGSLPGLPEQLSPAWHNRFVVSDTRTDRRVIELRILLDALDQIESCDRHPQLGELRATLRRAVGGYLIPKLANPADPMTVVFAGPTGSGKSTLINSLTRLDLSSAGVIRPTTRRPVILCHPDRSDDYATIDGVECEVVSGEAPALEAMTLVDTPDIDSTARQHREMAERVIDGADVVVFIASALRYADDVPWQVLRRARARGAEVVHVLNRVGSASSGAVIDYRSRLGSEDMDGDVIVVPEYHLGAGRQMLPAVAVKALARRLAHLGSTHEGAKTGIRERVFETTMRQAAEFVSRAEDAAREHSHTDEDLADRLSAASRGLVIPEAVADLVKPTPDRVAQAWIKAARAKGDEVEKLEASLTVRVKMEIESQVRHVAASECADRQIEAAKAMEGLLDVTESAVDGWAHFTQRMAEPLRRRDQWTAQLALMGASLGVDMTWVLEELFAEDAMELVDRARRELEGRAEVVFGHLAERIIELSGPHITVEDLIHLRGAMPRAAAGFANIDA